MAKGELTNRILSILKSLKDSGTPVEVMSFYNEVPVKAKLRIVDVDGTGRTIGWSGNEKLSLAVDETKRLYFSVLDPKFGERRVLVADVIYYSKDYIETDFPKFAIEPKLRRSYLRVTTSESLPVRLTVEDALFDVIDISEGGVAVVLPKGLLNPGDIIDAVLLLPEGKLNIRARAVNVSEFGRRDFERVGMEFIGMDGKGSKMVRRYVIERQREIISKIKLLNEESL